MLSRLFLNGLSRQAKWWLSILQGQSEDQSRLPLFWPLSLLKMPQNKNKWQFKSSKVQFYLWCSWQLFCWEVWCHGLSKHSLAHQIMTIKIQLKFLSYKSRNSYKSSSKKLKSQKDFSRLSMNFTLSAGSSTTTKTVNRW